jgi:hypothetical protein
MLAIEPHRRADRRPRSDVRGAIDLRTVILRKRRLRLRDLISSLETQLDPPEPA